MQQLSRARLVKGISLWRLSGLKGMSFEELSSTLDQLLAEYDCPPEIFLADLNERYGIADLQNKQAREMLWQRL